MDNPQPSQKPEEQSEQPDVEKAPEVLNPSYQRAKPFVLTDEVRKDISEAVASIDLEQLHYVKSLTVPERFQIAQVMIEVDEQNAVNRLQQIVPELDEREALYMVRGGRKNYLWQRREHE